MNRLTRRASRNFFRTHHPGLEPASGDFGAEPLGSRGRGVEANELAPRGFERRHDAMKAVDKRNLGLPPFARTVAGAYTVERLLRLGALPFLRPRSGGRRIARSEGRRTWAAVAFTGHRLKRSLRLIKAAAVRRHDAPSSHGKRRSQPQERSGRPIRKRKIVDALSWKRVLVRVQGASVRRIWLHGSRLRATFEEWRE